ncbi:MAG: hypothetical protein KA072_11915 [Thermoanaerobaculaceae bacterium]|nr:hypothetical protein [Thermoanaerobaculaceae bacterium]NLH11848.1 hypothetical protein [Holophagae bacterium]
MSRKTILVVGLLVLLSAGAALASRIAASFYLTYKYETLVVTSFGSPAARSSATRASIDSLLAPLKGEEFLDSYPWILEDSIDRRKVVVVRYYLLKPWVTGCFVYVVYDGPGRQAHAVSYRNGCE